MAVFKVQPSDLQSSCGVLRQMGFATRSGGDVIASMKKIMTCVSVASFTASLLSGSAGAAAPEAAQSWDKRVKCQTDDPEGRHIVTRYGNSTLGWNHFTNRHNIKKCSTLHAALKDRVDRNDNHGHLEYDGVAFETGVARPRQVRFTVVVQYTRKTTDGEYDAGRGQKIDVITAYCHNQPGNKCPAWAKM
ncbi:hypothetical protein [Streptomyces roseolus]|uniref:hypothetical protein n=1 Tax=Streptomyces roseolus TaxID=67358 RepID=UPI001673592F|nr:hypothetical protein [Streptomyces roseolus]